MFAGAPLLQCSLLWDQTRWDKCTRRAPSGNTINDTHDHSATKQLSVKVEIGLVKLGVDLSSGTLYTISVHVFMSAKCPSETIGAVYESH